MNISGLKRFSAQVRDGLRNHTGPYGEMFTQWAGVYAAFSRRRFDAYSRGGGDWKPLALSTVRARAKAARGRAGKGGGSKAGRGARSSLAIGRGGRLVSAGRTVSILRNTGILFNALTIGAKGNLVQNAPYAVIYGFDRTQHGRGSPTIQKIAHWHNVGAGHNPRRVILAKPDAATRRRMMASLRTATQVVMQQIAAQQPAGGRS